MTWQPTAGTAIMLTTAAPRFAAAIQCFSTLQVPTGTRKDLWLGGVDVAINRCDIAESFTGDWLLMIDDDHVFMPDLLRRLLPHFADDRVDIVVPLVPARGVVQGYPYPPLIYVDHDGKIIHRFVTHETGLIQIDYAATAVMLIRRRVFERMAGPKWFERNPEISHDLYFCRKARAVGCGIYCDLDTRVGHMAQCAIWPVHDAAQGRWGGFLSPIYIGSGDIVREQIAEAYANTSCPEPNRNVELTETQ